MIVELLVRVTNPESNYYLLECVYRLFDDHNILYISFTLMFVLSMVCYFDHAVSLTFSAVHDISVETV